MNFLFFVFLNLSFCLVSARLGRFFEIKVCINFSFIYSIAKAFPIRSFIQIWPIVFSCCVEKIQFFVLFCGFIPSIS